MSTTSFTVDLKRIAASSSNLPLVEEASADAEMRRLFERYRTHFGRTELPGILLCFATHQPLLRGMLEIAEGLLFVDGSLTRIHKELIATFVSMQNACPYCADSHGNFLRTMGGSDDLLKALRAVNLDSPQLTPAERALLRFASRVNGQSHDITRNDFEIAMQAGWTEAQLTEAVHVAALFAAFNRIANAFGLASPYPVVCEPQND